MITGIQITKANNEALLNSFGCWMMKKRNCAVFARNLAMLKIR